MYRKLISGITIVAAFAAAATVAAAATRPDDRAGPLGVGPTTSAGYGAVRPDDRAGPLGAAPGSSDAIDRYLSRQGVHKPVDPLAVSYLIGRGLSPSQVKSWTVGACSHEIKPASCLAAFETAALAAAATAAAGAQAQTSPVGQIIRQEDNKAVAREATVLSPVDRILAQERGRHNDPRLFDGASPPVIQVVGSADGFDWGDAGIGAGTAVVLVLLALGATFLVQGGRLRSA
jgi:hypothetical protein